MSNLGIARHLNQTALEETGEATNHTEDSIKQIMKRISAKLGVSGRAAVVDVAHRAGILGNPSVTKWWLNIAEWNSGDGYIVCSECGRELGYPESDVILLDSGQVQCTFCGDLWWPTWLDRRPRGK